MDIVQRPREGLGVLHNIIIIAGGPSVSTMPCKELVNYGHVIGVNESSVLLPCHEAISMDRLWMEARWNILRSLKIPTHFRMCAWKLGHRWPELSLFEGNVHADKLTKETGHLSGKNSGICAINLAYQRIPERIFLFGFDMKSKDKQHYFYDQSDLVACKRAITDKHINTNQSDSKYKAWLPMYKNIAKQCKDAGIKVYNVNHDSAIQDFEKISYREFLETVKNTK